MVNVTYLIIPRACNEFKIVRKNLFEICNIDMYNFSLYAIIV